MKYIECPAKYFGKNVSLFMAGGITGCSDWQEEFAEKAGVALTVIRKIEQGKENLSLLKVNQVLNLFGHVLVPANEKDETRIG